MIVGFTTDNTETSFADHHLEVAKLRSVKHGFLFLWAETDHCSKEDFTYLLPFCALFIQIYEYSLELLC